MNKKVYITTFEDYSKEKYKEGLHNNVVYKKASLCYCIKPGRSLFLFKKHNKLRMFIMYIVESKIFEAVVFMVIIANCIVMALGNQTSTPDAIALNAKLDQSEIYFVSFFLGECILKVISYGFVLHKHSYLRNGWNCLDFLIVVVGCITYILSKINNNSSVDVKALRAFRVLRALRLLSSVPSLQVVMNSIVLALKPLGSIAGLMLFLAIVYSIVGMNLFSGKLHSTCYNNASLMIMDNPSTCRLDNSGTGYFCTGLAPLPSNQQWVCLDFKTNSTLRWPGPNWGITNFDNMLLSLLTVFQLITKEGWTDDMYLVNDAIGSEWPWVYFVSLVLMITFFVLSLILGVLSGEFSKQSGKISEQNQYKRDKRRKQDNSDYIGYKQWIEIGEQSNNMTVESQPYFVIEDGFHMSPNRDHESNSTEPTTAKRPDSLNLIDRLKTLGRNNLCQASFYKVQKDLLNTMKSRIFFIIILALVFLNAAIMATEYTNQPEWLNNFQNYANIVFVVLFSLELILKVIATGLHGYFSKIFNIFDFIVVCFSIIELGLTLTNTYDSIGISVLRCVRILRIFKLTKYWDEIRSLVRNMLRSMKSIVSLLLLLGLFILIFALLGMQIFGGKFNGPDSTRSNFDTFFQAVFTVFQILTGDDWNSVMYSGINAMGGIPNGGAPWALYFVILYIMGNYILLNVFLAIAVESLRGEDDDDKEDDTNVADETETEAEERIARKDPEPKHPVTADRLVLVNDCAMLPPEVKNDIISVNKIKTKGKRRANLEQRVRIVIQKEEDIKDGENKEALEQSQRVGFMTYNDMYMEEEDDDNDDDCTPPPPSLIPKTSDFKKLKDKSLSIPTGSACFIFRDSNKFRVKCHEIVNHSLCKNMVLVCIIMSSIMLALEDPVAENSGRNTALNKFDYFFTGVFTLELIVKMVAYGIILHHHAFLRDPLNWIDLVVVVIGLVINCIPPSMSSQGMSAVKTLRVFRVLRPLRAINRIKGLKHVLQCAIVALKTIWKIMVITFLLEFMFAVIGVILMKGAFYSCNDATQITSQTCIGTFSPSSTNTSFVPRLWTNNPLNFDNVANGMLTLFTVATFSGWTKLLQLSIDSVGENKGPIMNNRQQMFIFYFVFIVLVAFFMINIFVGMVIVTFQNEGDAQYLKYNLDKNKRQCIDFALKARPVARYVPNDYMRYKVWRFVCSKKFENCIIILILLNTILLTASFNNEPTIYTNTLQYLNDAFTVIFSIECILKLYAFSFRTYFNDKMNIFDVIVITGSYVDIAFTQIPIPEDSLRINIFKLFRVLRLIRLLNKVETMRRLLWTFIVSFRSLPYVTLLLGLTFFIYSIMGMQFFGKIALDNDNSVITRNNNFQTFFSSLLVLFRCITGENWQMIMLSSIYDPIATCTNSTAICGTTVSYFYFTSFVMICSFLIMNLFVAVIIDNFDYLTRDNSILGSHHLDRFLELWSQYDMEGRGQIKHLDIENMLSNVNPPLGFGKRCPTAKCFRNLNKLNLPLQTDGTVLFNATLFTLVRAGLSINCLENESSQSLRQLKNTDSDLVNHPKKNTINELNEELRTIVKTYWKRTSPLLMDQIIPPNINDCVTIGVLRATNIISNWYKKAKTNKYLFMKNLELSNLKLDKKDGSKQVVRIDSKRHSNADDESMNQSVDGLSSIRETYEKIQDKVWTTLQDIFTIPEDNDQP